MSIMVQDNIFPQRRLIFEGNSLSNLSAGSGVTRGQYVPTGIYNNVRGVGSLSYFSRASSGRTQTQINTDFSVNIAPYIQAGDIIHLWEGTNDIKVNALTGAQAWDNVVTYINLCAPYNVNLVIGTITARDYVGDDPAIMDTYIPQYNTLVRNNAAVYGYTVADYGALAQFNTRSDCSNATYYTDALHMTQAGQDLIISSGTTAVNTVL